MITKKEKILSFAAAFLIPSDLLVTAVSNVYQKLFCSCFFIWAICGAFTVFVGFWAGHAVKKSAADKLHGKRILPVIFGAVILTVSIFAVLNLNMTSLAYMLLPSAEIMWYWLGCKIGLELDMLSNTLLGVICLKAAFLFPMCQSFDESGTAANVFLTVLGAEIVICAVLLNIKHLKKITVRGNSAAISKNTVMFNLKITLFFAFAVLFFFIFAHFAGYWLWEGIKALIKFLLSLTREPEKIDIQVIADLFLFEELGSNESSVFWFIITVIIVIAAIILLIKPVREIIAELLAKLKNRFNIIKSKNSQEPDYTDFYETADVKKHKKINFKRAYKAFAKEKNPSEKYRLGYKAFITGLEEAGEKAVPSDTARIHLAKEEKILGSELADIVVERYELLRYDDGEISAGDCNKMDILLKELMKITGRKTKRSDSFR